MASKVTMPAKKIILTVTNDLTYDQRMQRICRSLACAGYTIELLGRLRGNSIPPANEPYLQTRLTCIFNKGKLFYIEYNLRLLFYLLFQNFDAVCAIDLDTIAPVYIAGKLKGARLVYDAHEYFPEVPEVVRRPAVKRVWQWVEKTFVPRMDAVYTVSGGIAEIFEAKYGIKPEVIMNAPPYQQSEIRNQQPAIRNIIYQGSLNEGRGIESLLEAMQEIDGKLRLAGEGDLSQVLRELAKKLNVLDKVEFLGYVPPVKLREFTRQADIGINILEDQGLNYRYSLSNKFFDYINAGVPQVCIAFPEYKRINDRFDVVIFINECTAAEIKNAVRRLQQDSGLYLRLQKNCEVCSAAMNWQAEEKKLLALYGHILR